MEPVAQAMYANAKPGDAGAAGGPQPGPDASNGGASGKGGKDDVVDADFTMK